MCCHFSFLLIIKYTTLKLDSNGVDDFTSDDDGLMWFDNDMFAFSFTLNEQSYTISILCDDCVWQECILMIFLY